MFGKHGFQCSLMAAQAAVGQLPEEAVAAEEEAVSADAPQPLHHWPPEPPQ